MDIRIRWAQKVALANHHPQAGLLFLTGYEFVSQETDQSANREKWDPSQELKQ